MERPTEAHLATTKRIMGYLKGIANLGILYKMIKKQYCKDGQTLIMQGIMMIETVCLQAWIMPHILVLKEETHSNNVKH